MEPENLQKNVCNSSPLTVTHSSSTRGHLIHPVPPPLPPTSAPSHASHDNLRNLPQDQKYFQDPHKYIEVRI